MSFHTGDETNVFELPTINKKCLARVIATFRRLRSVRKPILAASGAFTKLLDLTQLKIMMSLS